MVLAWKSGKLKRVCVGSCSAEAQALEICSNALTRINILLQFLTGVKLPCDLRCDHKGVVEHLNTLKGSKDIEPRTAVQLNKIKDGLTAGEYRNIKHVAGVLNYADCLTKSPPKCIDIKKVWALMAGIVIDIS